MKTIKVHMTHGLPIVMQVDDVMQVAEDLRKAKQQNVLYVSLLSGEPKSVINPDHFVSIEVP